VHPDMQRHRSAGCSAAAACASPNAAYARFDFGAVARYTAASANASSPSGCEEVIGVLGASVTVRARGSRVDVLDGHAHEPPRDVQRILTAANIRASQYSHASASDPRIDFVQAPNQIEMLLAAFVVSGNGFSRTCRITSRELEKGEARGSICA